MASTKKEFLIFGTAGNPPTKLGMIELINELNISETKDYIFHIAGFGTNKIINTTSYKAKFIFHGEIKTQKLHEIYKSVAAVIINQKPSTGALIKIPELLIAGIPVISNNHAARNYYNYHGVYVYRSFDELHNLMNKIINNEPVFDYKLDVDIDSLKNILTYYLK